MRPRSFSARSLIVLATLAFCGLLWAAAPAAANDYTGPAYSSWVKKFNPDGTRATYKPAAGSIILVDLAVRPDGSLFDLGTSGGAYYAYGDYELFRLGPTGSLMWYAVLETGLSEATYPTAWAVAPDGLSVAFARPLNDALTVSLLDARGRLAWETAANESNPTRVATLQIGKDGAVYALAVGAAGEDQAQGAVVKLAADGSPLWSVALDPACGQNNFARLALSGDGGVRVAITHRTECGLAALDSAGAAAWAVELSDSSCQGFALDDADNAYVAAEARSNVSIGRMMLARIDADGQVLWTVRLPREIGSTGFLLTLDCEGNPIVTGATWDGASYLGPVAAKYDPEGGQTWQVDCSQAPERLTPAALTTDAGANIYLAAHAANGDLRHNLVFKYDSIGRRSWIADIAGENLEWTQLALGVDASGAVYLGGSDCWYDDGGTGHGDDTYDGDDSSDEHGGKGGTCGGCASQSSSSAIGLDLVLLSIGLTPLAWRRLRRPK